MRTEITSTLMRDMDDRQRLAREVLRFAEQIAVDRADSAGRGRHAACATGATQ